jgi:hypothetical protein|tara:strand:- start:118 stop:327 length:210 start_codon:yes stop_codon:yes gene_type:complete
MMSNLVLNYRYGLNTNTDLTITFSRKKPNNFALGQICMNSIYGPNVEFNSDIVTLNNLSGPLDTFLLGF